MENEEIKNEMIELTNDTAPSAEMANQNSDVDATDEGKGIVNESEESA